MKKLFFLIFIISQSFNVFSQTVSYSIKGEIKQESLFKYAYLYIISSKKTIRTPIIQNKFELNGFKPNKDTLITGIVFLGQDSLKTYQDIRSKQLTEGVDYSRKMVVEDASILIDSSNIQNAKVIGSELNTAFDEMNSAIKTKDYFAYFNKNQNSKVSLIFLLALTGTNRLSLMKQKADIPLYFGLLTDEIKNEYLGRKISEIIKKEYN